MRTFTRFAPAAAGISSYRNNVLVMDGTSADKVNAQEPLIDGRHMSNKTRLWKSTSRSTKRESGGISPHSSVSRLNDDDDHQFEP